jgi:uncharacterized membrane protein YbhN (UPF0104 family)
METGRDNSIADAAVKNETRTRRLITITVRLLVASGLLYLIFRMVSVEEIVRAYRTASIGYIVAGACLLSLNILLQVMKWRYMLHLVKDESSWWEAFSSVLLGITLGSFTPGQLGELGGRTLRVNHSKASHIVGLTLVDRTQIFLVISMAGLFSYSFFLIHETSLALAVGFACASICLYLYFRIDLVKHLADRINLKIFRHRWIDGIIESFTFIGREHFLSTLLYSLVFYGVIYLQMYFLINAFAGVSAWNVFL